MALDAFCIDNVLKKMWLPELRTVSELGWIIDTYKAFFTETEEEEDVALLKPS